VIKIPKQFETKAETAEDMHKKDAAIRWFELVNTISWLEKKMIFKSGDIDEVFGEFIQKFKSFYWCTYFYLDPDIVKEVDDYFKMIDKNIGKYMSLNTLFYIREGIKIAKKYSYECYIKGMFLEEQAVAEEGF